MRFKTRIIILGAVVAILAIMALIQGCASAPAAGGQPGGTAPQASSAPASPAAQAPAGAVPITNTANQALMATCQVGWFPFSLQAGYDVANAPFHPGPSRHASLPPGQQPNPAFQVTLTNTGSSPVSLNWVATNFYLNGQQVGAQTQQANVASTIQPGQHAVWATDDVPDEAGGSLPARFMGRPLQNIPGVTCQAQSYDNATGGA